MYINYLLSLNSDDWVLDIASLAATLISSTAAVTDDAFGAVIYTDPEVEIRAGRGSAV
jgi:hypothetical protein